MGGQTNIQDLEAADFDSAVLKSHLPSLVAFGSPWSPPCQAERCVLQELADLCGSRLNVFKVNVEDNLDLTALYEIRSIPTMLCFQNGQVKVRIMGTCTKETILSELQPVLQDQGNLI